MRRAYVSPIKCGKERVGWLDDFKRYIVTDPTQLAEIFDKFKGLTLSVDTETTGLDFEKLEIVGYCFCADLSESFYVPLTHRFGVNFPDLKLAIKLLHQAMANAKMNLFYNFGYDGRVLRNYGVPIDDYKAFDVMALVWNVDVNIQMPSLKGAVEQFCGIRAQSYGETLAGAETFQNMDPKDVLDYAASDPWFSYLLAKTLYAFYQNNKFIVDLDNAFVRTLIELTDTPIRIDKDLALADYTAVKSEILSLEKEIHQLIGQPFVIDSPDKLSKALLSVGVDTGKKTAKTGNMTTGIDELNLVRDQHPSIPLIIKYKVLMKHLSSYVKPFIDYHRDDLGGFRIAYQAFNVPTARLSSGLKEKEQTQYFAKLNVQSIPKPEPAFFNPVPSSGPAAVLGFDFVPDADGKCESFSPKFNSRNFFLPSEGHYVVDMDYSGEEVVIIANLSKDPAFLEPLKNKRDLHKETAVKLWGLEAYNKERRRVAKIATFGLIYGGYPQTLQENMPEKSLEECEDVFNRWWKLHSHLAQYQKYIQSEARKSGFFKTLMGRLRRVDYWYRSTDRRDISFADRTVSNGPVQGLGGDIMRYALVNVYRNVLMRSEWKGKVKFMATLHDEFVFSVTKEPEYFTPIVLEIKKNLEALDFLKFDPPLEVGVAVGNSWGSCFDFEYSNGTWKPKLR